MILTHSHNFILLVLFFSFNVFGQSNRVFTILENDTNYFERVDGYGNVLPSDSVIPTEDYLHDGITPYSWRRKNTAPDGKYITYYLRDAIHYRYESQTKGDTVCFIIRNYKNGVLDGTVNSYYFRENTLMQTEEYAKGQLLQKTSCYRYPKGELEGSPYFKLVYYTYSFPLEYSDIILTTTSYHPNKEIANEDQFLIRHLDTFKVYTYQTDLELTEYHLTHYYLNQPQTKALEYTIEHSIGHEQHWCPDEVIYYHVQRNVQISRNGWYENGETVIVNNMTGDNFKWGKWFNHCR